MANLARIRRTLGLATDLSSIVGTMKTLAAVNIRQFEAAAVAIDEYVATIELALQICLREVVPEAPQRVAKRAWIVIGSDQGLCGAFNERLSGLAISEIEAEPGLLVVVGHRAARRLEAAGLPAAEFEFRTPGSASGVTDLVSDLLVVLGDWLDAGVIDGLSIVHNQSVDSGLVSKSTSLLPLDASWLQEVGGRDWESRVQPTQPHNPEDFFRWLVREWLFARLYFACAVSLAAENAARLVATQAAQRSLEERVDKLSSRYRTERQQAITEELLDLHR